MAAIVSQSTQEVSAARAFWNAKMQAHPNLAGGLAITQEVAGWFLNGHALVKLGQWMIRVAGYVAETALLFAVLWISATSVAPGLVELVMSEKTMQYLVWLALVTLALIPEIILGNAIINAAGHWHTVTRDGRNVMAWIWAAAFTIPTLLFLALTALTLNALVSDGGTFVQASNSLVGWRCFAGWTYGLLQLVYAGIGRRTLNQVQIAVTPAQANSEIHDLHAAIAQLSAQVSALQTPQTAPIGAPENTLSSEVVSEESASESDTPIAPETLPEEPQEERNNITLMSAHTHTQSAPASAPIARSEKARKAASIIRRNPQISAPDLAKKAQISTSYARKLLVNQ